MNIKSIKTLFSNKDMLTKIFIAIAIAFLIILVIRKLKGSFSAISTYIRNDESVNAIDRRTGNEQGGTYTDAEYEAYADRLYSAMDGPGTDEEAVSAVLSDMMNDSDWARLVKAFGQRDSSYTPFDSAVGLESWIVGDFSNRRDIEKYINGSLAKHDCTKRF